MTMAEKILARASGKKEAYAGEFVVAKPDMLMTHDSASPAFINMLEEVGVKKLGIDPDTLVVTNDHSVPAYSAERADSQVILRKWIKTHGIKNFYDLVGGVCHQIMAEKGHVRPGELIVATDSHTTTYGALGAAAAGVGHTDFVVALVRGELWFRVPETIRFDINGKMPEMVMSKDIILKIAGTYTTEVAQYKSVEFHGPVADEMSVASRMTISNMAIEIGGKFGIFEPNRGVIEYVKKRTSKPFTPVKSDAEATYERIYDLDVSDLEPQVACPHDVGNVKPISEVEGIKIDQAVIATCTNARYEDLEVAARILKGRRVHPDARMIVVPASWEIYLEALKTGLLETFIEAGVFVCGSSCGPCSGRKDGVLATGERCITSANRNFKGRMGNPEAEVYLGSPATVAASAIKGVLTDPRNV